MIDMPKTSLASRSNPCIDTTPHPTDKRKDLYLPTEAGLDLIPVLLELSAWGAKHAPETADAAAWLTDIPLERALLVERIKETVRKGGSVFGGPGSVIEQLGGLIERKAEPGHGTSLAE